MQSPENIRSSEQVRRARVPDGSDIAQSVKVNSREGRVDFVSTLAIGRERRIELFAVTPKAYTGKRVFNFACALVLSIVALPIILVIAMAIRATGSPVFFSHKRVGLGRKTFRCYKFRSMVPNAEKVLQDLLHSDEAVLREWREKHKLRNDPRVTPLGRILRRTSLDELPQLWNVLKGDMAIVGPRPIVDDELQRFGNKAMAYCSVRPGMTGLWQVLGRSNTSYSRRVSMDVFYARSQSISLDLWIMLKTVAVVFHRAGAF